MTAVARVVRFALLTLASSGAPLLALGAQDPAPEVTGPQMIDAFEGTFGVHPGQRRNHIKGTCAAGAFVGTPDAAALSRSALFSGKAIPVVARFSLGGGSPEVPDAAPAFKPDGQWHKLRVLVHGGTVRAWLDMTKRISVEDDQYQGGQVAIWSQGDTAASFDDWTTDIYDNPGTPRV